MLLGLSLDFCCDIQKMGLEFDINSMKASPSKKHLGDAVKQEIQVMDVQVANLQQLFDAII